MPSVPSPSQSPVTGTVAGQLPLANMNEPCVPVLSRVCRSPLR